LDLLANVVRRDGAARYFRSRDGVPDVHFSAEGHAQVARWLLDRLGPGLAGKP